MLVYLANSIPSILLELLNMRKLNIINQRMRLISDNQNNIVECFFIIFLNLRCSCEELVRSTRRLCNYSSFSLPQHPFFEVQIMTIPPTRNSGPRINNIGVVSEPVRSSRILQAMMTTPQMIEIIPQAFITLVY